MENQENKVAAGIGAYTTLFGSICMLAGAGMLAASGADLDRALDSGELAKYLVAAESGKSLLIANLTLWIIGVFSIGAGATMMARLSKQRSVLSELARYNYWVAIPIVVINYIAWFVLVVRLSGTNSPEAASIAEAMGWFASRADWVGTILVLGIGPALISAAGKNDWVPKWLGVWSIVSLLCGFLNLIAIYTGGLTTYGFIIIPVGMGWMIAASIVLFKLKKA